MKLNIYLSTALAILGLIGVLQFYHLSNNYNYILLVLALILGAIGYMKDKKNNQ